MPGAGIAQEINASAGTVGTSYQFTLGPGRNVLRVNAAPNRTATLTNLGPATIRQATIDNAGTYGTFGDVATGGTQTVTTADRVFILQAVDVSNPVFVAIS